MTERNPYYQIPIAIWLSGRHSDKFVVVSSEDYEYLSGFARLNEVHHG